jgi:hypothetical protein
MTVDTTIRQSRRALLAASIGGAAALVAQAIGRPLPVRAANGDFVTVGGGFTGTQPTAITNSTGDAIQAFNTATAASGLFGHATAGSGTTYGLFGRSNSTAGVGVAGVDYSPTGVTKGVYGQADSSAGMGVHGKAASGVGVRGDSTSAMGVYGVSSSSAGVQGKSTTGTGVQGSGVVGVFANGSLIAVEGDASTGSGVGVHGGASTGDGVQGRAQTGTGVRGTSVSNTGVIGYSGNLQDTPTALADTGVYGYAVDTNSAKGVLGVSLSGRGVQGQASSGLGVRGFATSGVGLSGEATTGYALRTTGRVRLDKSAGKATIGAGSSSVVVNPGTDLTSTTVVIATLNGNAGGSTTIKRVALDTAANTFTVYLTANSTALVAIGWLVLN